MNRGMAPDCRVTTALNLSQKKHLCCAMVNEDILDGKKTLKAHALTTQISESVIASESTYKR